MSNTIRLPPPWKVGSKHASYSPSFNVWPFDSKPNIGSPKPTTRMTPHILARHLERQLQIIYEACRGFPEIWMRALRCAARAKTSSPSSRLPQKNARQIFEAEYGHQRFEIIETKVQHKRTGEKNGCDIPVVVGPRGRN